MLDYIANAYFSMEIALQSNIPTYSGGLGVLAGDTLKSMADQEIPTIGVSLIYHKGYFKQTIDSTGKQKEAPVKWDPKKFFTQIPNKVTVTIEGVEVTVGAWMYLLQGVTGHVVPVVFLDTNLPENKGFYKTLTDSLYGGDSRYRLAQEIVLGIGGVKMLESIGCTKATGLSTYHMNEGHAALLTLALLQRAHWGSSISISEDDHIDLEDACVFTTHTPVPAGHDVFPKALVTKVLGKEFSSFLEKHGIMEKSGLNMTKLAIHFSGFINGVAKRHAEVSRKMFPNVDICAITNGVHVPTWTCPSIAKLFDKYIPDWKLDNNYLRYACELPLKELKKAHEAAKAELIKVVKAKTGKVLSPNVFTIGFARRAATYKRADLLFEDYSKLIKTAATFPIQIVYAGKAHPADEGGKALIKNVIGASKKLANKVKVVYIENYDMDLGRILTSGVDIWLNNPIKPLEASGTSGMKAALNGVPNLSTLDGWWVEGCVEGVTGWEIEDREDGMSSTKQDLKKERSKTAEVLYSKLENTILPLYYKQNDSYCKIMRNSISLNASYFNTQRMVGQYSYLAY